MIYTFNKKTFKDTKKFLSEINTVWFLVIIKKLTRNIRFEFIQKNEITKLNFVILI